LEAQMLTLSITDRGTAKVWLQPVRFVLRELREIWPPTLFFFVGFNLILFTKRLILEQILIEYFGFLIATTGALVVGKAVLVADAMPFLSRFDRRPLAYPIIFKTVVYTFFVFVARLVEQFVGYLVHKGVLGGGTFVEHVFDTFSWARFTATQLWIFVLFLLYVTASEVNQLLGDGELYKILFQRPSTTLQSTRRKRIRLLTRLSRLTEAHSLEVLTDRRSQPHTELAAILRDLAQRPPPNSTSSGD
jgi:hypothetical protein